MKLVHFSNAETITVESRDQGRGPHHKPEGFWVSDESADDGWSWWCRGEDYKIGANAFAVELSPDANILRLTNGASVRAFDEMYAAPDRYRIYCIDWPKVAKQYQGILITPYQWSLRLSWYYTWDCASGCIWDASAITSISRVVEADAS